MLREGEGEREGKINPSVTKAYAEVAEPKPYRALERKSKSLNHTSTCYFCWHAPRELRPGVNTINTLFFFHPNKYRHYRPSCLAPSY